MIDGCRTGCFRPSTSSRVVNNFHVASALKLTAHGPDCWMRDAEHGRNLPVGLGRVVPERIGDNRPALGCVQVAAEPS